MTLCLVAWAVPVSSVIDVIVWSPFGGGYCDHMNHSVYPHKQVNSAGTALGEEVGMKGGSAEATSDGGPRRKIRAKERSGDCGAAHPSDDRGRRPRGRHRWCHSPAMAKGTRIPSRLPG